MQFTKNIEKEQLSPIFVEPVLQARLTEINELLAIKLKELKKAPEGSLRIKKCKNTLQYYLRMTPDDTSGHYIPSRKLSLIKALAQKDYDKSVVAALKKESRLLQNALRGYKSFGKRITHAENAFSKLSEARRKLIKPVCLPDGIFAEIWQAIPYEKKLFPANIPEFHTLHGERVRSKSEIIIADTLSRMNIPYRYEYPLEIKTENGEKRTFYPDFLCLNLRTRQEFIWEHFGMMDDPEYTASMVRKLKLYEKNGIYLGKNLIISVENSSTPIGAKQIEKTAARYLQ
ncbi:MAG: hypothetical protein K5930_08715 [Treponemataceae bacterium]|nr:hypothetical protein [Treponemataceae bacterium]